MYTTIVLDLNGDFEVMTSNEPPCNGLDDDVKHVFCKCTHGDTNELVIAGIVMRFPHPNIVRVFEIQGNRIFMEYLDTATQPRLINDVYLRVADYLAQHNIVYIDWKADNIGFSHSSKQHKLFDFNMSGLLFPMPSDEWRIPPPMGFALKQVGADTPNRMLDQAITKVLEDKDRKK